MTQELENRLNIILTQWHEAGRAAFERDYANLDYDSMAYAHTAKEKAKYVCLDEGSSGAFLLDKTNGNIYRIKYKYGVPDKRRIIGHIATIDGAALCSARWR